VAISSYKEIADTIITEVPVETNSEPVIIPASSQIGEQTPVSDLQDALVNIYQVANPSVVYIITPSGASGSGFVYDQAGHIVTNNHVVTGARSYEVVFSTGARMEAELVGTDVDSDLAVITVDELPQGIEPLELADPDSIQVGQFVVAIGNPFGVQGSMSFGIISGLDRSLPSQRALISGSTYSLPEVIQTDAPINPGNSGGPLLNLTGEVVGVNAAIASQTGENSGVGFSIPVAAVEKIIPSLIENGEYTYPYMGVGFDSEISLSELELYDLDGTRGVYVVNVTPGGPGEEAGLIAANQNTAKGGDVIIAIDGQAMNDFADLNSYLVFNTEVGQTIKLTVLRNGETINLDLVLGARPKS
jgi:2-alkenal reductase